MFQRIMDINVKGTWNMATEAFERMEKQENLEPAGIVPGSVRSVGQGSIVNLGSGASLRGVSGLATYAASKHAVLGLTRSWARSFPNLRVNLVAPGMSIPSPSSPSFTSSPFTPLAKLYLGSTLPARFLTSSNS